MQNKLEKKYGLLMAICMVVGIVIGSGIFFKGQDILIETNGNVYLGVLAWVIGGVVMMICALTFSTFASKYEKVNGIVDYSEAIVGKKYAYFVGWFSTTIYLPAMTSVLAWVTARYTLVLFGNNDITGGLCMALAGFYLVLSYAINCLAPKLSGKIHISTTLIKLIPIILMVLVGSFIGIINNNIIDSFTNNSDNIINGDSLFSAIVTASFAYEGWIIATSINAEIKDSKRNLPKALIIGTLIVMILYITYFISLAGGASVNALQTQGATSAFVNIFGKFGGTILNVLIVVSCFGTLNGLMLASTRSMYSISYRKAGPKHDVLDNVDPDTNMPYNSGIIAILICSFWLLYFYGANLTTNPIFGFFSFDSSELPIITTYAIYIPIFVAFIIKEGRKNKIKNIILPILAIIASLFMVFAAFYSHGIIPLINSIENGKFIFPILAYLIIFSIFMLIGWLLNLKKEKSV